MNKAQILRKKHEEEIKQLQDSCIHSKSSWMEEHWAIGHSTGNSVKVCSNCEKILAREPYDNTVPES